ncbi:MAG: PQQ-dependent sugar dehydrogenase [Actinomycetota bacterium]|nr:PQQ-dependent sugar dehydrogenase [Actinomycetota bacterium]
MLCAVMLAAATVGCTAAGAATLPAGFRETTALSGLTLPTAARFAPDGRVFVAEKSGLIMVFDSLADTTPTRFADLRTQVHNFHDRGLLGLALDPSFPAKPYVYVLYTYDAAIGGTAPRWGTPGATSDGCPTPPGETDDGCVVSGRLSRLTAAGDVMTGPERVLIEDWCSQYPSHTIGALAFGPDGYLYVSGGDGASFNFVDFGQDGSPPNPCGDPPAGIGGVQRPPTAEGGALRSQDVRTLGDPAGLDGTLLRVDPTTGAGAPGNPFASSPDPNLRRIVAYGLRNPFRITVRPGTNELWAGEVGWSAWEEIDRVPAPDDAVADNFGWPCYEGNGRQDGYDSANLNLCENLYASPGAEVRPYFAYLHSAKVVPGESCPTGNGSSIAGVQFYRGGPYPDDYDGALFFADFSRNCVWVMKRAGGPLPSPSAISTFVDGASGPVDLVVGPTGELFYVDILNGSLRRIEYEPGNRSPVAVAGGTPRSGATPLTVRFDSAGSRDPDPDDTISVAWDLDGDGEYDDSTAAAPTYTYTAAGTYAASLQVTDNHGASSRASVTVTAGDTPPHAVITSPAPTTTWKVGDTIAFAGTATDGEDGTLPASALTWTIRLHHCGDTGCHIHPVQTYDGTATGSFVASDHEYPSYLELVLTATDSSGMSDTDSVRVDPRTANLTLRTNARGLKLALNGALLTTPFTRTVIQGSSNSVSAPTPQTVGARSWRFLLWSDLRAQTHNVKVNQSMALTALYLCAPAPRCLLGQPPGLAATFR